MTMKEILKPEKERWVNLSLHLPEATKQRIADARKIAARRGLFFNAMINEGILEVCDLITRSNGKRTAFTNGSASTSDGLDSRS
jgi:glutaminase